MYAEGPTMKAMLKNFVTAVQFLTIFTLNKKHVVEENDLAKSMVYFPLVGFPWDSSW